MLSRVQAMLKHLQRSEGPERSYAIEELSDIHSHMYKCPWWRPRSLREKMRESRLTTDEQEYFSSNLPGNTGL